MKVSVFGGTGFIGTALVKALQKKGHTVTVLDLRRDSDWVSKMSTTEAVVNLAGYPLFGKRWTTEIKSAIYDSRIEGTKAIVKAMGAVKDSGGPKILVNGSAVGFYGPENDIEFDEHSHAGADFLAFVCRDWEEAAQTAQNHHGIRTTFIRTGIVLGANGGALKQLLPPFKAFIGGPVGSGKQWMSWIHLEDIVGIILHALETETIKGPLNGTSPSPVRNADFSKALGHALGRPSFMKIPGLALYAVVGEASELLVNGQKVLPVETLKSGYVFKFPTLEQALQNILGG